MSRLVKEYKNLNSFKDRHKNLRHYYRAPGKKPIPVKGEFGSHEFDANYEAAKAEALGVELPGEKRIIKGSVNDLCALYYQSFEFRSVRPVTQKNYRRQLEEFRVAVGNVAVRAITRAHINKVKTAYVDRPGAGRTILKRLNMLFNFAIDNNFRTDNPCTRVKLPKEGAGFTPWTDDEIELYEKRWASGTVERLGMYLCLYTLQRRSDVVKMGRQHVRNNEIAVVQGKTDARVWIPLHSALRAELDLVPTDQLLFLINPKNGGPRASEGFGNFIRGAAKEAGIKETRGPHGLRKAGCRRLIEIGCDAQMAISISGHASEKELKPYIRDVDKKKKARQAMKKWEENVG